MAARNDIGEDPGDGGGHPAIARLARDASTPSLWGMRFAFLGRTSTDDVQDPTLSLPRQLRNSRSALPAGAVIVAHFYDIESGRKDLDERGHGRAHERFDIPIPRDGGIADLLAEADRPVRRFDAVMCESIERVARRTYYGTRVEHLLEKAGVALFAADEPISLTGKRATTILTRRVKQSVAEWYVLEVLEKSWDGLCEHTRQGWNVGRPPYGYLAEAIPHPVPAKRAEGKTKTRLVPDPVRGPVVTRIFTWRAVERLGYLTIADRLNADLERYPPPTALDPARQRDAWSRSSVRDVLCNPKYTGYMVYNRRATKSRSGKVNPPSAWIWSPKPTHEPLVTRDIFDAVSPVAQVRERSRNGSEPNRHPQTRRTYLLRSYVLCELCGRRMAGKTRKNSAHVYYCCRPILNHAGRADRFDGHPASVYVREDLLAEAVHSFFSERIFGPDRRALLADDLVAEQPRQGQDVEAARAALRRALADNAKRQDRLVRSLEERDDPTGALADRVNNRLAELEAERGQTIAKLDALETATMSGTVQDIDLLDMLPTLTARVASLPEELQRELYDVFHLTIRYNRRTHQATIQVDISGDTVEAQAHTASALLNKNHCKAQEEGSETQVTPKVAEVAHLVRAPNGSRKARENSADQHGWPILAIEEEVVLD
jgi:DNA invertase Pin-like site-specific DNA recombinase